jgi:hypothetical protein
VPRRSHARTLKVSTSISTIRAESTASPGWKRINAATFVVRPSSTGTLRFFRCRDHAQRIEAEAKGEDAATGRLSRGGRSVIMPRQNLSASFAHSILMLMQLVVGHIRQATFAMPPPLLRVIFSEQGYAFSLAEFQPHRRCTVDSPSSSQRSSGSVSIVNRMIRPSGSP